MEKAVPMAPTTAEVDLDRDTRPVVRVLYTEAEIAACAEAWKSFQQHPNTDWDFYWHINKIKNQNPCVLELRQNGQIRSLWVGRIEQGQLPIRIGYVKLGGFNVTRLHIITGGVMGDDSEAACRLLLQRALQVLSEKRFDTLVLANIPTDHVLARLARTVPPWLSRDWAAVPSIHWRMTLPESFAEFLKKRSKKHRYWLNRLPRVLEEAYPKQVRIRSFQAPGDVADYCRDADLVAQATYQHKLGESFRADDDYKARCQMLARKGLLRGYILYLADQPRAYWMATACRDTVLLNFTGYYAELKKFELGTILLMKLFEDHCGTAIRKVDFGHGGAMYKERFGDESFHEASMQIYRLTPQGMLANALTGTSTVITSTLAKLLSKLGLLQKLKTLWRRRLSGKTAAPAQES